MSIATCRNPMHTAEDHMFSRTQHVILDRDGVLNVECSDGGHVGDWSQWRWIPGALEGLGMLTSAGVYISVATNQSGVGRGFMTRAELDAIHGRMIEEAARHGGVINHVFVCPHLPNTGCGCRKPAPGLLLKAIEASRLPPVTTVVVGDDLRDLEAARAAGLSAVVVRTGKGRQTEAAVARLDVPVFDDLREFAAAVMANFRSQTFRIL